MQLLQQSEATAAQRRIFFHAVDATDGITAETGLTGAGRISKNGAATAATTANIVEIDSTNMPGRYYIELTATELDTVGIIEFRFKAAACAEVIARGQVVPFDPYDAVRAGLTALPNAAAEAAGGLFTRGAGAGQINQSANGQIDVNAERLNNVAQSLLDLKGFADAGYDPATNKVQGVVLVDTLTTYTGNTPQTGDSFARLGAPAGLSVSADIAAIEAQTDDIGVAGAGLTAITSKTDNLPTDPADQSLIIAATDAVMARLGIPAGASVSADIAAVKGDTDDIGVAGAGLTAILDRLPAALVGGKMDSTLSAGERDAIATALLTLADGVELGFTVRRALRIIAAAAAGKVSGGPGSPVFRNMADTADQITGTADASGNRTAAAYGA